ncbi:MAG TPA: DUF6155 family protein [Muribaculum sp.]|uniref:DUF6155 family protein n=1 Tax=Heminiphilus faecis TaxID=2601703 RepID=A0ABV4CSL9_9BACT|nr:DUF6155 family protein [Heminiphilus faecis]HRF67896.1 DUF6155 family protein [Muribaculum sp.]
MSKTSLKRQLMMLDRDQIATVLLELYDARKDAREYLEYYVNPDENKMLEKYKSVIAKEFFPSKGRPRARTSVCKKAVKEFITLHPGPGLVVELRLFLLENLVRYALRMKSWIKDSHCRTACSVLEDTLDYMFVYDLTDAYIRRVDNILLTAGGIRGELPFRLGEIYDGFSGNTHDRR